jgi:UDP-3-O-[3-hydroxymyristoyl] N-acetylglucosamine deacetylase/3-hydroxyacyl-[acyl-carrier-protein] dehydratase
MTAQRTISKPVSLSGRGLFSGIESNLTFEPAPTNHGVVFRRRDLDRAEVPARIDHVVKRPRRTALRAGDAVVEVTEHVLSAVAGMKIDNLVIDLDAPEVPAMDGSAKPFFEALTDAGIDEQDAERRVLRVTEPVVVRQGDAMLAAVPADGDDLEVLYELHYADVPSIGRQLITFDSSNGDYAHEIAPSRTFVLEAEARALMARGFGKHLSPAEMLVIGPDGPVAPNAFRFDDEPVRHKLLDLLGDLYLLGAPIQGRIVGHKAGHSLNHALVRRLVEQDRARRRQRAIASKTAFDVRAIARMLPHRYPMQLVDRVVEIDGDQRAIGVKNVTINEPFFQGHYPGTPIMPGVLIVEAMAQLSGVLIGQRLENTGKLAMLLSLDRVKLRRRVVPGDQLVMEAEAVRVRSRIAHMRCRAYVGEEMAAEAEVKFMLMDATEE